MFLSIFLNILLAIKISLINLKNKSLELHVCEKNGWIHPQSDTEKYLYYVYWQNVVQNLVS